MAAGFPASWHPGAFLAGWRGLGRFWIAVLLLFGIVAGVIETLGPAPPRPAMTAAGPVPHAGPLPTGPAVANLTGHSAPPSRPRAAHPGRDTAGPIADPDPSLLEPYPGATNLYLPRISADGRVPMAVYAAGFDPSNMRPRVGILIAGLGMSGADSVAAIKDLPEGVTLAISPYARNIDHLLEIARMTEHEYLLSIPMEPQGYPVNDPDNRHALMTSLPPSENLDRLRWVLARLTGYVGVTSALGQMHGERLTGVPSQFGPVLEEVAHRGLLFVDAQTGQPPPAHAQPPLTHAQAPLAQAWNRSVDVAIDDDPVDAAALDQRLDMLTHLALDKGSALGLVSVPRPVTLARVAAWTTTLTAKGLALAPVSALALPPGKQEAVQ